MAIKRPSFLKRQKEQQRMARAAAKREAKRARKHSRETVDPDSLEPPDTDTLDAQGDEQEALESEPSGDEAGR